MKDRSDKFTYTDLYRSSYLRWPRRHYFSSGTGGMASSNNCRHSAFRRIGSKFPCSPHGRSDTLSTYSSSGTDYYSDTSIYTSYSSGYDSYTSTDRSSNSVSDTDRELNTSVTDVESSYYLADTEGGSVDESSSFVSHTESETNTSTDKRSYTVGAAKGDSCTSADGNSSTLRDGEYDTCSSTVQKSGYRADFHTSSVDSFYTSTGQSTTLESSERSLSHSSFRAEFQSSTIDSYYDDTSENTKSTSSEKVSSDTTSFSTCDYYNRRYGLKRYSSRRKWRSSRYSSGRKWRTSTMNDCPSTTVSRKYNPSNSKWQYSSKRRTSYCACAGGRNKKRSCFDSLLYLGLSEGICLHPD